MRVLIRADASISIGTGHIMRCLTIAKELKRRGATVHFVCRRLPGDLCDYIESKDFPVNRLYSCLNGTEEFDFENDANAVIEILQNQSNPELLIVDHYLIDERWEKLVRPYVQRLMVIDDLANRRHECHILLDYNIHENYANRYDALVPKQCKKFLGPNYVILKPEFLRFSGYQRKRKGRVKRILIFFGGTDPTNETEKALKAIQYIQQDTLLNVAIDVVVGVINPNKERIKRYCHKIDNMRVFENVSNMAQLMAKADLALGGGGITNIERMYMKLPTIAVSVADNQTKVLEYLGQEGYVKYLGPASNVDVNDWIVALKEAIPQGLNVKYYDFKHQHNNFWREIFKI